MRGAIQLINDDVLRNVDEPPRQITGVRCFQCGVGQPFARAVRRNEILQHGQSLTEVCRDRRLDDFA